jgi:lysophospholipid acyltransferase (LPLAT)-like uncharacterized protein
MVSLRRLTRSRSVQFLVGYLAAKFLRLVWHTNSFRLDPPDAIARIEPLLPAIVTFWHGQHFLMPFLLYQRHWVRQDPQRTTASPKNFRGKVLISRHQDGEMNAIAAELLGVGTVRGSGAHGGDYRRKGGVPAFKSMVETLNEGINMALTADVPKVSRRAGLGIILLARNSGRPILPVAITTSRFVRLDNWDQTTINLPFGRGIAVVGDPLTVPPEADEAQMERLRQQLQDSLNDVNRRAYALLGRNDGCGDE